MQLGVWRDETDRFGFVDAVLERLPERYEVVEFHTFRAAIEDQVCADLDRVDIVWYEWSEASGLPIAEHVAGKPAICRVYPSVAYAQNAADVAWQGIDQLVLSAPGAARTFQAPSGIETTMIPSGVAVDDIPFDAARPKNTNVALYAPLHAEDNPLLLIQLIEALVAQDERFNVHVAGAVQDTGVAAYFRQQIDHRGIEEHVHFYGAITPEERGRWLDQCSYVLSTRLRDGDWTGVMEAMARGLRPIIHAFPGADELFAPDMLFHTVEEAVSLVLDDSHDPTRYRRFVQQRYHLDRQVEAVVHLLDRLAADYYPNRMAAYHRKQRASERPATVKGPSALLKEARMLYEAGELEGAADRLMKVPFEKLSEDDALRARVRALRVAMDREEYTDALFHADAALDLAPDEPLILHLAGQALWIENHREAAAEALVYAAELLQAARESSRELRYAVDDAQVYFLAGEACEALEQREAALSFFQLAREEAPDEALIEEAIQRIRHSVEVVR